MQLCYFFNIFLWSKIQKFKSKLLVFRRKAYIPLFTKVNSVKGKMKVNTQSKTNPQPSQINLNNMKIQQTQNSQTPQQNLNNMSMEQLYQLLQQLQQQKQLQQHQNQNNVFIVKSGIKASVVAIKVEQMLLFNERVMLSGLGYAVPVLLDSVMLIRKDYAKLNKNLIIENIELFENKFDAKTVTGLKITLKLQ